VLREAMLRTFERRQTSLDDVLRLFDPSFTRDAERQRQWQIFLRRIQVDDESTFEDVLNLIQAFIDPIIRGIAEGVWHPVERIWRS
jgi:hypothetical protein